MSVYCTIGVLTFRRPVSLARLLESLEPQRLAEGDVEIVVVDNDVAESARAVVDDFRRRGAADLRYFVEPRRNISLARNRVVSEARGTFLAFIDDDEVAAPGWLARLVLTQKQYDADAVFGQMAPLFAEEISPALRRAEFYYHDVSPTGSHAVFFTGGNCLIRASVLSRPDSVFDPAYGNTGGEDGHLFGRLEQQGCRLVTCAEAVAYEWVPPERGTIRYLFLKSVKNGNSYARRQLALATKYSRPAVSAALLLRSLLSLTVASCALMCLCIRPVQRVVWLKHVGSNIGKILAVFHVHWRAYGRTAGPDGSPVCDALLATRQ